MGELSKTEKEQNGSDLWGFSSTPTTAILVSELVWSGFIFRKKVSLLKAHHLLVIKSMDLELSYTRKTFQMLCCTKQTQITRLTFSNGHIKYME